MLYWLHRTIFSLFLLLSIPLHAMECGPSLEPDPTIKPSSLRLKPIEDIKWTLLSESILGGVKLSSQQESTPLSRDELISIRGALVEFQSEFMRYFGRETKSKSSSIARMREFNSLFSQFYKYIVYGFTADMGLLRSIVEPDPHYGALRSERVEESSSTRDPFFSELQSVSNLIFSELEKNKVHVFSHNTGIIPVTERWRIGYCTDKNGYVPFPFEKREYIQYIAIGWGAQDLEHQRNFLIRDGEFVTDSGFVLNVTPQRNLKVTGYYGENSQYPFTKYKTTAHATLLIENPVSKVLMSSIPKAILEGKKHFKENERVFIPVPSNEHDSALLEILFLEDLRNETDAKVDGTLNIFPSQELQAPEEFINEQTKKIENQLIREYEKQVKKEQEKRSRMVQAGKVQGKKRTSKKGKKKGKRKPTHRSKGSSPSESETTVDTKRMARKMYEEHKVEGRIKYKEILKILNNVVKEFPEQVHATLSVKGSHFNVHGDHGGFTIVKPHGGKDDLPSYAVNKIISRLLTMMKEQSKS